MESGPGVCTIPCHPSHFKPLPLLVGAAFLADLGDAAEAGRGEGRDGGVGGGSSRTRGAAGAARR